MISHAGDHEHVWAACTSAILAVLWLFLGQEWPAKMLRTGLVGRSFPQPDAEYNLPMCRAGIASVAHMNPKNLKGSLLP